MTSIKINPRIQIQVLDESEVIALHRLLTIHPDILKITEPVSPEGVKDINLLSSAVQRQNTGFGEYYVYDNVFANCATLVYGIACNHGFHNGNKRAALLCLIKHLYKNGYVLVPSLNNDEIYEFLRSIAAGELKEFASKYKQYKNLQNSFYRKELNHKMESDIKFIEKWIQRNAESKNQSMRQLRWQDMIEKLERFKITVQIDRQGQKITMQKETSKEFLGFKLKTKFKRVSYPFKGDFCSKYLVSNIRRDFELNKSEGLDNVMFYADTDDSFLDYEIQLFKKAIYKLSKN